MSNNGLIESNVPAQDPDVIVQNGVPTIISAAGVNVMSGDETLHTISILVENRPGVLARVSHVFARRGFNLESLAVSRTEDHTVSRITVVVAGDDNQFKQIGNQLFKLIDVIKVIDHTHDDLVGRELALIKIKCEDAATRTGVLQIAEIYQAKVVASDLGTLMIEVTGKSSKVDAMQAMLANHEILELVRTGLIVLTRGAKQT